MLILCLEDGLGNQLFEYAFARSLQQIYREPLYISVAQFDERRQEYPEQKDALRRLALGPGVFFLDDVRGWMARKVIRGLHYFFRLIYYPLRRDKPRASVKMNRFGFFYDIAGAWRYVPAQPTRRRVKLLLGRWQSERYFTPLGDTLRRELRVAAPPSPENSEMLRRIGACSNPVCLHVRLGDYCQPEKKGLLVCTPAYYRRAVRQMLERVPDAEFFVFSNSAAEVRAVRDRFGLDARERMTYVELNNPAHEELRLMYHCRHFILSNSTLSWWGEYLSGGDGVVLAPSRWNNMGAYDRDVYRAHWTLLDVPEAEQEI